MNTTEREGQFKFYEAFLPLVDNSLSLEDILQDDNDGVLKGNLLEFKLRISDLNAVLFQCVKYLSALRIKGKPVPANIVLIDLTTESAYLYHSEDYLEDIEKVYVGGASKDNAGFVAQDFIEKLSYSEQSGAAKLISYLRENRFTRIHIDENCIVGWATAFYREVPNARKEDFIGDETGKHNTIGEIRNPSVFKDYIFPYSGASNLKFGYLMDKLNDFLQKKNLGAFYTPEAYANKAHELLREAIERVPEGNDYIILDRCAGTGNLELQFTEEELSHCILSTIEYYEYKVLQEQLGSKVRHIIPPVEAEDTFCAGLVRGADALSKEYVQNPVVQKYLDDSHCTIILFENPPYSETTSQEHQKRGEGKKSSAVWKSSWVVSRMREDIKADKSIVSTAINDMGNAFIWSAFKYYLRQPTDSYVVFSPIKYWKAQGLIKKRLLDSFAGDRHHFHARKHSCVLVALWANEPSDLDEFSSPGYDIIDGRLDYIGQLAFRKTHTTFSKTFYDKRSFSEDVKDGILLQRTGDPMTSQKASLTPLFNENIVGYLVADSTGFDEPDLHSVLIRAGMYNGHGFYLRSDNFLEMLPVFAATRYIPYNGIWTERGRIMKSGDAAQRYRENVKRGALDQWLLKVLLFTCAEYQNHMRSFTGADGRFYRNELTLDTTNGSTLASTALMNLKRGSKEAELISAFDLVLQFAKKTRKYDPSITYGLYQIGEELNTWKTIDNERVYDYPELNGAIRALKEKNKQYYLEAIVPLLFEYEFLK